MKRIFFLPAFIFLPLAMPAQTVNDLATADGLLQTFYTCLDVQRGSAIDSAKFMSLFWPGAQLDGIVPSRKDTAKMVNFRITPETYLQEMKGFTATHRFKEWETGRQTVAYGHMLSVFSGYQLIDVSPQGDTTSIRGVNTFQLFFDGKRWWITYCNYEEESAQYPLPAEYLGAKKKEKKPHNE